MAEIEVVGVYAVEAEEPCALVELLVRESHGSIDVGAITQEDSALAPADWQVPYSEKILNHAGTSVVCDLWQDSGEPDLWSGEVRLAFFFHYLDVERPLSTPLGMVSLPAVSERPERLAFLAYDAP